MALNQLRILLLVTLSKKVEPFAPTPRDELLKIWNDVLKLLDWADRFRHAPFDLYREFCKQALIHTFPPFDESVDYVEDSETYVREKKTRAFKLNGFFLSIFYY